VAKAYIDTAEQEGIIQGEERQLLRSIVDFGDTLVREVMTPRPDIVAVKDDATIGTVRALFREQEYSRFPVYRDSLDNISGFVFIKDLWGCRRPRSRTSRSSRWSDRWWSCRKPSGVGAVETVSAAADAVRDRRR
jgi:CBS domain containing-hemolysin-like protein